MLRTPAKQGLGPGALMPSSGLVLPLPAQFHKRAERTAELGALGPHREKPGFLSASFRKLHSAGEHAARGQSSLAPRHWPGAPQGEVGECSTFSWRKGREAGKGWLITQASRDVG